MEIYRGVFVAMFRGNWGIIFRSGGLALIGILSISFYVGTISYSQSLQQEAANKAEIHRQNAEYVIEYICSAPSADSGCAEQARNTQRESEREEYDLGAQRMSAWWAQVMGIAALIGMGLSALGVWLVWTTFRETKESNTISRDGLKSAEAAAERARFDMIDAERAFVTVIGIEQAQPAPENPKLITVNIEIHNAGRQIARDFEIGILARENAIYSKPEGRINGVSQIVQPTARTVFRDITVTTRHDGGYYLMGFVSYRTVYGARFKSYFCFFAEGRAHVNQLGQLVGYNLVKSSCSRIPKNT